MKKQLLAFSLIAASGLVAQNDMQRQQNNNSDSVNYSDSCCPPNPCCTPCCVPQPKKCIDCECYTPAYYDLQCDWGVILSVDFLYWYSRETNLAYSASVAVQTHVLPEAVTTTLVDQVVGFPTAYHDIRASWDPGVRVGLGWNSSCDGWDFYAMWTYYRNKEKSDTSSTFIGLQPENLETGILNPWNNTSVVASPYYDRVSAKWRVIFNQFDIEIGRKGWLSRCFSLRPYTGIRAVWTKTRFNVQGSLGPDTIEDVVNVSRFSTDNFHNKVWAAGFLGGLQPNWYFCGNFVLFGNVEAALAWGKFRGTQKERYNGTTDATIYDTGTQRAHETFFTMQTALDVAIGLRWEETWCCDRYRTNLDFAWEHHIWFGHGIRHKTIDSFDTVETSHYIKSFADNVSDLVMGGLVIRARFDF